MVTTTSTAGAAREHEQWPGGKPAALALNLPGSIPGHGPIFPVALALLLLNLTSQPFKAECARKVASFSEISDNFPPQRLH